MIDALLDCSGLCLNLHGSDDVCSVCSTAIYVHLNPQHNLKEPPPPSPMISTHLMLVFPILRYYPLPLCHHGFVGPVCYHGHMGPVCYHGHTGPVCYHGHTGPVCYHGHTGPVWYHGHTGPVS